MKKSLVASLVCGITLGLAASSASADFSGAYNVTNWTQNLNGGTIDLTGAPNSVLEISANNLTGAQNTDFTIAAAGTGLVSFTWDYLTTDVDGPSFDPFGYLLNGSFTQLSSNFGGNAQSGFASFSVNFGEIFGFRQRATDSALGSAFTTISDFSAPAAPVPEPETYAMMLAGLSMLGFMARRRKQKLSA